MQTVVNSTEHSAKTTHSKSSFFGEGNRTPFFQAKPDLKPETEIQRQATALEEESEQIQRQALAAENEPEDIQRQATAPEEEAEQIQRQGLATDKEPEDIQRQATAPEEEAEQIQRQALATDKEPEDLQRQETAPEEESEQIQRQTLTSEKEPEDIQRQKTAPEEESEQIQRQEDVAIEAPTPSQVPTVSPEAGIPTIAPPSLTHTEPTPAAAPTPSQPSVIQTSLKVGAPDDKYEREADEMAEKVQRMPMKQWTFADSRIDAPTLQRQEEEDGTPDLQAKLIQRAPDLQRNEAGGLSTTPSFTSRLQTSGPGSPLPTPVRHNMESAFGADFGTVRIHTGTEAAQMSNDIGARAFTHQNNIFFNDNQYNPGTSDGQFLLAHELTHTVQQGAAVKRQPTVLQTQPQIQATFLDSIGDFLGDIRDRVIRFVRSLPGYFLLSVIIGSDPITGETVERTGLNFIRGFMLLLPGGEAKYNQLRDSGGLQNAANWMDQQIAEVGNLRNRFSEAYEQAKNSISAWDIADIEGAFDRITGIFAPVVRDAIAYGEQLIIQVLTFIKDALLGTLVNFVRDHTRAYPLMRTLLGRDPITGEEVPATMENILQGFLSLTESGEAYYNKLVETGVLARATTWMRAQIATLPTLDQVVNAFSAAWDSLSFADLVQPMAAFDRIYNILADPIGRIVNFVVNVAAEILRLIKEALLSLLRQHASEIRGYRLMTVLLGRDPVTDQIVERNARNILSGFVELVAGPEQFQQIEQSGAIERMVSWLEGLVERTGITLQMVIDLFLGIWNSVSINDLVHPIDTFNRIVAKFQDPINRVLTFIIEVIKKIIEIVLQLMNVPVDVMMQIVERAMAAYEIIKRDPIAFLMNLLRALKQGFQQFFDNILTHLLGGLTGWLFSELETAGIRPPTELSFRAILGFVLDVLGITMERIWQKLAEHPRIGPERVARIRGMIDRLTGIWTIIQEVITEGPGALWRHIEEQLSNLWTMVLDYVKNWVMERIVTQMVTRLLSMLDPTGIMAVIRSVEAFYRAVQSFIQRLAEILRIVNSFVGGILEIAQGNLSVAANYLERTMAGAMPTVIGFLANQIGLNGLGTRIGEMIERVREVVDRALGWLINKVVDMGFSLLDRMMAAGRSVRDAVMGWLGLKKEFHLANGEKHEIYFEGTEDAPRVMVASKRPKGIEQLIADRRSSTSAPALTPAQNNALTQALAKKNQLDSYIRSHRTNNDETESLNSQIDTRLNAIKQDLIDGDAIPISPDLPLSNVTFAMDGGRGKRVTARPLTKLPGNTRGSKPTRNENIPLGWPHIRAVAGKPIRMWVKAHLLNENLHGPGQEAWNLVPGSQGLNASMRDGAEKWAKDEIAKGEIIHYQVEVTSWHVNNNNPAISNYFPSTITITYGYLPNPAKGRTVETTITAPPYNNAIPP